jgi:hypothetical protein
MALIKGKQIQGTSVSLDKLDGTGSVSLSSGTITLLASNMTINNNPVNDTDVVRKAYVDSVATGLDVKNSVQAIFRDVPVNGQQPVNTYDGGNSQLDINTLVTFIEGGQPIDHPAFDGYELQNGDRVLIASAPSSARQKINGIWVFNGVQFTRAEDADNITPNTGEVSGGMFTFVEQGTIFADTGWVLTSPNGAITQLYDPNVPLSLGYTTQLVFTQFSYAGVVEAGTGLSRSGTVFNVNYDNSSIGINGSDQLYIKASGVTVPMLEKSTTGFQADSGLAQITLGNTLNIYGGSNGIDTAISGSTLTINLDLSELATVTSIADNDFIAVSSYGAVNQKITFANLKTLIGAASQLNLSVEGGSAASFDLDTDTLDFATGTGLTFTKSASTAGTTDTLVVTLSNNALTVHQSTSYTTAIGGNTDITIPAAAEVFSVTVNGVMLKKSTNWVWPQGANTVVRVTALPYALEASDEIEITYRVN